MSCKHQQFVKQYKRLKHNTLDGSKKITFANFNTCKVPKYFVRGYSVCAMISADI